MKKDCITVEEAGRRIGLSRGGSYLAVKRGELPVLKFGRRLFVPLAAFEKMLEDAGKTVVGGGQAHA